MIPIGGAFLIAVGLAVILGGLFPPYRQQSMVVGLLLGSAVAFLAGTVAIRPEPPTAIQAASLVVAVAAEIAAFLLLMPRLYRAGERAVIAGTLAIVGGHFAVMIPAFGPLIGLLAALCLGNAWAIWKMRDYSLARGWTVDGAMKLAIGACMLSGFPLSLP
jgi:hypothetical protein